MTGLSAEDINIINNIAQNLLPVQKLVSGLAYVLGAMFFFKAITSLKALGESKAMMSSHGSMKEPMIYFLVAAMLLFFPSAVSVSMMTAFGTPNILAYAPIDSGSSGINSWFGSASPVGRSLAIMIQTIGLIAFVRGWILIARSASQGQQPGGVGKGLMHILGGVLAMNIVLTLQVINNTLYGT